MFSQGIFEHKFKYVLEEEIPDIEVIFGKLVSIDLIADLSLSTPVVNIHIRPKSFHPTAHFNYAFTIYFSDEDEATQNRLLVKIKRFIKKDRGRQDRIDIGITQGTWVSVSDTLDRVRIGDYNTVTGEFLLVISDAWF